MNFLFLDTETTNKANFKLPYDDPSQPNLIQLGVQLTNEDGVVLEERGSLINTTTFNDWNGISPEAENVHGISEDLIRRYGLSASETNLYIADILKHSQFVIAHNESFDSRIVNTFFHRTPDYELNEVYNSKAKLCTMKLTTNLLKLPGKYGYKWPSLEEAYRALVNRNGFSGAHNALVDVNACREIFFVLKKQRLIPGIE